MKSKKVAIIQKAGQYILLSAGRNAVKYKIHKRGKGAVRMTVFEAIYLMLAFGTFIVALLSLIVLLMKKK